MARNDLNSYLHHSCVLCLTNDKKKKAQGAGIYQDFTSTYTRIRSINLNNELFTGVRLKVLWRTGTLTD